MSDTKVCELSSCEGQYERTPQQSPKRWESRRFCSPRCAALSRRGVPPVVEVASPAVTARKPWSPNAWGWPGYRAGEAS